MWYFLSVLSIVFVKKCAGTIISPSYYCADMSPQPHVNIAQLMGMWYGIEILSHKPDELHEIRIDAACPIIYVSEDKTPTTTYSPLHKDYNYGYNYGTGYDGSYKGYPYETTTRRSDIYGGYRRYNTNYRRRYWENIRRIRLLWDENGNEIIYNLRYNISTPGFWISTGPQNGSELEQPFQHFAGTIQVIKAVGSHLVLTFCHQLPERQLFTVLLSRETKLNQHDIIGVHNLLHRKGLSTNNVRKVCTSGSCRIFYGGLTILILLWTLFRHFKTVHELLIII